MRIASEIESNFHEPSCSRYLTEFARWYQIFYHGLIPELRAKLENNILQRCDGLASSGLSLCLHTFLNGPSLFNTEVVAEDHPNIF